MAEDSFKTLQDGPKLVHDSFWLFKGLPKVDVPKLVPLSAKTLVFEQNVVPASRAGGVLPASRAGGVLARWPKIVLRWP